MGSLCGEKFVVGEILPKAMAERFEIANQSQALWIPNVGVRK